MSIRKYDLHSKYCKGKNYNYDDLINEIIKESKNTYMAFESLPEEDWADFINSKFEKEDRSGIIDRLYDTLNFDVKMIAKKGKIETFKMLKLLWYLFYLDADRQMKKFDTSLESGTKKEKRYALLDLLAKPRIENVQTSLGVKSYHGDFFNTVCSEFKSLVPRHEAISERQKYIAACWRYFLTQVRNYALKEALGDYQTTCFEIRDIRRILNKKIVSKIEPFTSPRDLNEFTPQRNSGNNIFGDFWCMLNAHTHLCRINADIKVDDLMEIPKNPPQEYVQQFRKFGSISYTWEQLQPTKNSSKDEDYIFWVEHLKEMATTSGTLTEAMKKNYSYALKYAQTVANWLGFYIGYNFSQQIEALYLVPILQEIMFIKEDLIKTENDFLGYKNLKQSLIGALSQKAAGPMAIYTWQKRLVNRIFSTTGRTDLRTEVRKLENIVYKIEKFIFTFPNIDDMELVSDFLFWKALDAIPHKENVGEFLDFFTSQLSLRIVCEKFQVEFTREFQRDITLLQTLMLTDEQQLMDVINQLADKINGLIKSDIKGDIVDCYRLNLNICFKTDIEEKNKKVEKFLKEEKSRKKIVRTFDLGFVVNLTNRTIIFQKAVEVLDENGLNRLFELGLLK